MDSLETSRGNQVSLKYLGFLMVWDKGRQWQILGAFTPQLAVEYLGAKSSEFSP